MIYSFKGFIPVVHPSSYVHPLAAVTGNVVIGRNVYIGPGAAIRGDWGEVIIEDGCNIQESLKPTTIAEKYYQFETSKMEMKMVFQVIILKAEHKRNNVHTEKETRMANG